MTQPSDNAPPTELALIETQTLLDELGRRYPGGFVAGWIPSDPDCTLAWLFYRNGPWVGIAGIVQAMQWTLARDFRRDNKITTRDEP